MSNGKKSRSCKIKLLKKKKKPQRSGAEAGEDAIKLDTFLKENDKRAHDAVKEAEAATKKKNDKVQEIKRLNQQLQAVVARCRNKGKAGDRLK